MKKKEYEKFIERYDKFKKNNLPTPFWDDERQVFEYVYFYNGKSIFNTNETQDELEVSSGLTEPLGEIAYTGFYYPFTDRHLSWRAGEENPKTVVGHNHAHSFEEVVRYLYDSPESFSIAKDEEEFYSKQELEYLRRVQKYLLFIGMQDVKTRKTPIGRYRNKRHSKYENALIYKYSNFNLEKKLNGECDFRVIKWYPEYKEPRTYKPGEYRALLTDEEDNFKMFVEFTQEEVKLYKDIKKVCQKKDINDNDKVILVHFKILEKF